jgi:hypothetical protein
MNRIPDRSRSKSDTGAESFAIRPLGNEETAMAGHGMNIAIEANIGISG